MSQFEETIAVVGLGYVGLPLALLADRKQHNVVGIDIDESKIASLKKGEASFLDDHIAEQLSGADIDYTTDASAVTRASVIVVCVPTPVRDDHTPDLTPVKGAVENIAPHLQEGQLVILESTVNPGVSRTVVLPLLESISGLKCGEDFYLAHAPERINPGDSKWTVENINRVVGAFGNKGLEKAIEFYGSILTSQVKRMKTLREAEAVKIVENSFRDINIAFVNELARSFSHLGIDVVNVIDGAATKPFGFMAYYPGCGVGGHCIPVDPYYLIEYAKKNGFDHDFLSLARHINNQMPAFVVDLVVDALNEKQRAVNGSKVTVLGLAYKPNIRDSRESPAYKVIHQLQEKGAHVEAYDPHILDQSTANSLADAIEGADALVLATGHDAFTTVTPELLSQHEIEVLIDGRNFFDKQIFTEADVVYKGVGT